MGLDDIGKLVRYFRLLLGKPGGLTLMRFWRSLSFFS